MRIAVVHNAVGDESAPDERDVLVQADAVAEALQQLGHQPVRLACTLDLAAVQDRLREIEPDVVFNLVESLNGQGSLIHLFPALLDAIGVPYTGSGSPAVYLTSHKILAKQAMAAADLATPPWIGPYPPEMPTLGRPDQSAPVAKAEGPQTKWILKSLWEHASVGINEDELVLSDDTVQVQKLLKQKAPQLGGACYAEAYVDGREFNLSLLAGPEDPQVLPPAEIIFQDYPADKLRIVGYRAKWEPESFEYKHTPRCFDFAPHDTPLLGKLAAVAQRCWRVFALSGYARIDFRVDGRGQPWILEINANPCLSPDAGFAAAVAKSGLNFGAAVERILSAAQTRSKR
ncbi:MAG: D-alanine--D-alanine ligase [Desulfobacterales bacterium]|nr:MAG: D-alanine--D-alanine ligase [Desulfobacterales bacterium]